MCERFNINLADLLTLCWWSQKNAKNRFQLVGLFDEYLGACVDVIMIRALQGHWFDWLEPRRLHKEVTAANIEKFKHLVHGTNGYALDSIMVDYLQPGGGGSSSAVQLGGGGLSPAVRVDNHFAAFAPWDKECVAGVRKESEVHIFYDLRRIMEDNVGMMVSVNGATLSRDRITPDAIIMVTANARGRCKIVWHTYL